MLCTNCIFRDGDFSFPRYLQHLKDQHKHANFHRNFSFFADGPQHLEGHSKWDKCGRIHPSWLPRHMAIPSLLCGAICTDEHPDSNRQCIHYSPCVEKQQPTQPNVLFPL